MPEPDDTLRLRHAGTKERDVVHAWGSLADATINLSAGRRTSSASATSRHNCRRSTDGLRRNAVALYPINPLGVRSEGNLSGGHDSLEDLARSTGGKAHFDNDFAGRCWRILRPGPTTTRSPMCRRSQNMTASTTRSRWRSTGQACSWSIAGATPRSISMGRCWSRKRPRQGCAAEELVPDCDGLWRDCLRRSWSFAVARCRRPGLASRRMRR